MNILLINYEYPPHGGGASNATQEMGRAYTALGHSVTVLTGGAAGDKIGDDGVRIIQVDSIRYSRSQSSLKEMFSFLYKGLIWINQQTTQNWDFAIVFFALPCGPIAAALKAKWKLPYIVSLRGGDVPGFEPSIAVLHHLLMPIRRFVYKSAQAVVANSFSLAQLARAADPVCVSVIPNGIDTSYYRPTDQNLSRGIEPLRLLIVCRLHHQKMVPEAIRRLAQARSAGIDFVLSIIGDGPERSAVELSIKKNNMADVVQLYGWLDKDELIKHYQRADCYLNLSGYEGMSNTVLEAMSCGLPVIASDIASHRYLIDHAVNGFLLPSNQDETLGDYLKQLATDKGLAKCFGKVSRQRALDESSWVIVAANYLDLLDPDLLH